MLLYATNSDARQIAAGVLHSVVLKTDGTLWSCGMDFAGQLGHNTINIHKSRFTQIGTDTDWAQVCCGANHNLALKTNGTLWSWGWNSQWGQCGYNILYVNRSVPTQVGGDGSGIGWTHISAGVHSSFGIRADGTLWSWGHNAYGELGIGHSWNRAFPQRVGSGSNWRNVFASTHSTLGLRYE
jgi:alpha-tubulin suppressor-like RCC1 family protein